MGPDGGAERKCAGGRAPEHTLAALVVVVAAAGEDAPRRLRVRAYLGVRRAPHVARMLRGAFLVAAVARSAWLHCGASQLVQWADIGFLAHFESLLSTCARTRAKRRLQTRTPVASATTQTRAKHAPARAQVQGRDRDDRGHGLCGEGAALLEASRRICSCAPNRRLLVCVRWFRSARTRVRACVDACVWGSHLHARACACVRGCMCARCSAFRSSRPSPFASSAPMPLSAPTRRARPCPCGPHLHSWTGLTPATSAPGPGSPQCHICSRTGLTPATSAPGPGSPRPHLQQNWARPLPHLHNWTGFASATSAAGLGSPPAVAASPGLGSPRPHLQQDWAHPGAASAPALGSPPAVAAANSWHWRVSRHLRLTRRAWRSTSDGRRRLEPRPSDGSTSPASPTRTRPSAPARARPRQGCAN